jgi:hypothetical protein
MELRLIRYADLNSKQKEAYNFHKVAAVLADYGFNCIKLDDDWQGADFLAYHKDGTHTLKVQLKGRLTIDKKYIGKDLYMAFPLYGSWYLVPHDDLVSYFEQSKQYLQTNSWRSNGHFNNARPGRPTVTWLQRFRLESPAA